MTSEKFNINPSIQLEKISPCLTLRTKKKSFPFDLLDFGQKNQTHPHIKPLKGLSGVFEIKSDYQTDTYRTEYAIKLGNSVYVLHAFKKKSKTGIKTPKQTIDLIKERLKQALIDC